MRHQQKERPEGASLGTWLPWPLIFGPSIGPSIHHWFTIESPHEARSILALRNLAASFSCRTWYEWHQWQRNMPIISNYGHYILNVLVIHAGWQQFLLGQQQDHHSGPPLLILWLSCLPEDALVSRAFKKSSKPLTHVGSKSIDGLRSMPPDAEKEGAGGWGGLGAMVKTWVNDQSLGIVINPFIGNDIFTHYKDSHGWPGAPYPMISHGFYDHRSSASGEAKIDFECEPWPSFPQARDLCQQLLAFQPEAGPKPRGVGKPETGPWWRVWMSSMTFSGGY